jgi:hypothetical protein
MEQVLGYDGDLLPEKKKKSPPKKRVITSAEEVEETCESPSLKSPLEVEICESPTEEDGGLEIEEIIEKAKDQDIDRLI